MFLKFEPIVNKMCANKLQLPYDDHERALKLLQALDRRVWDIKVAAITKSPNYKTIIVDELFNKLKCTKIDQKSRANIENPTNPSMALVSGLGGSSANPSSTLFALSSLMPITEE